MYSKSEILTEKEKNLLDQVRKNNRVAQKELYYSYVKMVGQIAYRYVREEDQSKDVVQNTFVRVFQNIQKYDSTKGQLKSWIAKIAVNEALSILRSRKKVQFSELTNTTILPDNSNEARILSSLHLDDISAVVHQLKDEERIILDLFYFEQYTHKEIASICNISTETSRIRLHRAKQSFFKKWNKIYGNELRRII